MITIAVCDDDPVQCGEIAKQTEEILRNYGQDFLVKRFFDGREIPETEAFDIILLDVKMPGITGTRLAVEMRGRGRDSVIIFITAYPQYVYEGYEAEAFRYLLKPVSLETLQNTLFKALKKLSACKEESSLIISRDREVMKIPFSDILYIESFGRKVQYHLRSGKAEEYKGIGELERKLPHDSFFRCHKCYMVNLRQVSHFKNGEIYLENGENIPLSKRRAEDFKTAFLSYVKREGLIL